MITFANEWFLGAMGGVLLGLLAWCFRTLPRERWQFVATVPVRKNTDGSWTGVNLTFYGLLSATAHAIALAVMLLLIGAIRIKIASITAVVLSFVVIVLPSARWVARIVEGKQHTFTVSGATFVAVLVLPPTIAGVNYLLGLNGSAPMPVLPVLSAIAIAHAIGEGIGRSACISFGCCYGKPVRETRGLARWIFERINFVFEGRTKKIAYADRLDGVPVVPVQAITATLYVVTGLVSAWFWLRGAFCTALLISVAVTQAWRIYSETLRADYRGGGRFTAYQMLSLATMGICAGYAWWLHTPDTIVPSLRAGLAYLWSPGALVLVQVVGIISFLYAGRSEVTAGRVMIDLRQDRI
ncbi:MAG TPA: prolipoprotein diacylglyceryl transferase family protein [Burkholderiales bacterium]|nr:prolipoprotein diacylglyceryl transferase family protein [Burkholderiales bacterium]